MTGTEINTHTRTRRSLHVDRSPCFLLCLIVSLVSVRLSGLLSAPSRLKRFMSRVSVLRDLAESVPRLSSPIELADKNIEIHRMAANFIEIDFSLLIRGEPPGCVHLSSILRSTTKQKSSERKET